MLLSAGFTVTGRIVFEGRPANGANPEVSALRVGFAADNRFLPSGVGGATATDGAVTITGIHAGDYHVNVNPILTTAGPPPAVPAALQTLYVKSIRLGVDDVLNSGAHISGPPTSELQIVVGVNGGVLEGRVADDQQRPAINAMVVLVPAPFLRNRFDLYKAVATDTAGHFRLQGIAPGDYKIFAWHYVEDGLWCEPEFIRGYEGRGKTVRIEEGNNGSIDVSLIRE